MDGRDAVNVALVRPRGRGARPSAAVGAVRVLLHPGRFTGDRGGVRFGVHHQDDPRRRAQRRLAAQDSAFPGRNDLDDPLHDDPRVAALPAGLQTRRSQHGILAPRRVVSVRAVGNARRVPLRLHHPRRPRADSAGDGGQPLRLRAQSHHSRVTGGEHGARRAGVDKLQSRVGPPPVPLPHHHSHRGVDRALALCRARRLGPHAPPPLPVQVLQHLSWRRPRSRPLALPRQRGRLCRGRQLHREAGDAVGAAGAGADRVPGGCRGGAAPHAHRPPLHQHPPRGV
mmetsp:Transcript_33201/g.75907  ORF Transcript_33201/g.75907 Transcript_33201/m.75907 type:complete len:284 (-) Transcript_33201:223-1074(-)